MTPRPKRSPARLTQRALAASRRGGYSPPEPHAREAFGKLRGVRTDTDDLFAYDSGIDST